MFNLSVTFSIQLPFGRLAQASLISGLFAFAISRAPIDANLATFNLGRAPGGLWGPPGIVNLLLRRSIGASGFISRFVLPTKASAALFPSYQSPRPPPTYLTQRDTPTMAAIHKHESAIPSLEGGEEKPMAIPLEDGDDLHALAARGHVATDQYVR